MEEKLMGRDEFIKLLFNKGASLAEKLTADIYHTFKKAENTAEELLTIRLLPIQEFYNRPLLITSTKPPIFLLGNIKQKVVAITALCPQDQFLLSHISTEEVLFCSNCSTKYLVASLPAFPLIQKEGYFYLSYSP